MSELASSHDPCQLKAGVYENNELVVDKSLWVKNRHPKSYGEFAFL